MRLQEITKDLQDDAFNFFYWFSRFEFVLKENGYLKNEDIGAKAEPSWEKFIIKYNPEYTVTDEAKQLLSLHPRRQVVSNGQQLEWTPVGIEHCNNELCKVVTMLKTIRNNLFHGGKHGDTKMDDINRSIRLLATGKIVLDQFSRQFQFESDYERIY